MKGTRAACRSTARAAAVSGAQSLRTALSISSPSRRDTTAAPWSPTGPETTTTSPSRTSPPGGVQPSAGVPTPAVLMNILSALPRGTTFVSPVTTSTPASAAAPANDSSIPSRSAAGRPSSRIRAQEM